MKAQTIFFSFLALTLNACSQDSDTTTYEVVESSCTIPATTLELEKEYLVLNQDGKKYVAEIKTTPGLTHGFSIQVKRFLSGSPDWENNFFVTTSGDQMTFEGAACTHTLEKL